MFGIRTSDGAPRCPHNDAHGDMTATLGSHSQRIANTATNVRLEDFPSWRCEKCTTTIIDRKALEQLTRDLVRPIAKQLESARLPPQEITLHFRASNPESVTRSSNVQPFRILTPERTFSNDAVYGKTTEFELELFLRRAKHRDLLLNTWNLRRLGTSRNSIALFHGPSGTGKTLAAEALAAELGKSLLVVDCAELESKYVGETPKNLKAVFQAASSNGAVLFLDESDSFLSTRLSRLEQAADYAVNATRSQLILLLDAFDGVVVFASNLPGNIDSSIKRRVHVQVHFPLPDLDARYRILTKLLPRELPLSDDVDLQEVATLSHGLSGRGLVSAVITAAALAAGRPECARRVTAADFERALEATIDCHLEGTDLLYKQPAAAVKVTGDNAEAVKSMLSST